MDKLIKVPEDWWLRLATGLKELGIVAATEVREKIQHHLAMIIEECQHTNLVSKRDRDFLIERHVLPSLAALQFVEDVPLRGICIGSGAGFPGVPVKLSRQSLNITLLEATRKKAIFLEKVVVELGLMGVDVRWDRAENLAGHSYDLVLARGIAPMQKLQELAAPLLNEEGRLITWKGSGFSKEMEAVRSPKFRVETVQPYDLPRILVILRRL